MLPWWRRSTLLAPRTIGPAGCQEDRVSNNHSDRSGHSRRLLLQLATAPMVVMIAPAAHAETEEKAGAVEDVKGEAFAEKDSKRRDLERAAPLYMRDQVGTGAASRL